MKIGIEKDMTLASAPQLVRAYALTAHAELVTKRMSDVISLSPDAQVIAAWINGEVVGVIAYSEDAIEPAYWVELVYVTERLRRSGIFKALWSATVKTATENEIRQIVVGRHVNNSVMQRALEREGVHAEFVVHHFWVHYGVD